MAVISISSSPWELAEEGSDIISDIIVKLGTDWKTTIGEELSERMEQHIEEVNNPVSEIDTDLLDEELKELKELEEEYARGSP